MGDGHGTIKILIHLNKTELNKNPFGKKESYYKQWYYQAGAGVWCYNEKNDTSTCH